MIFRSGRNKRGASGGVSRADVEVAYQALLGRKPDSEEAIRRHLAAGSFKALIESIAASDEAGSPRRNGSPFFYYHSTFDAEGTIRRHAASHIEPDPQFLTNFLGVRIDTKFLPLILSGREGSVEAIPIPANWHADIAEWAAALRAVDLAKSSFTMAELGCGWGCWMNNTGVAARRHGLSVHLIGVEGDEGHIVFAHEACAANGFAPDQTTIMHGIAASREGIALFPRQEHAGHHWGLEPIFDASTIMQDKALATGSR